MFPNIYIYIYIVKLEYIEKTYEITIPVDEVA